MTWSVPPVKAEFVVSKEPFGEGGFRRAYRATSSTDDFKGQEWVVKKYLPTTLACLQETGQSAEDHSKKIVQTHMLAGNFAEQLQSSIATKCLSEFGATFSYNKVYMGRIESSSEYVTIAEFIEGKF
ncbi:transient receptor potential cation channel subfamily M member 6-like [Paramuricea clavata]|uniref:Transient receptor potential cation channel subfamily M member 6-like n=1 Tax=Paramuricea clavata TaxID=317549 RepID=A0A6S7HJP9_PARCT|nr:transient receptor potential cation channel subfamily M member 6-like [Paramuricea clavata]